MILRMSNRETSGSNAVAPHSDMEHEIRPPFPP